MRIIVSTHQGRLYDEQVDQIVISGNSEGEFGIMENHVPVICVLQEGYIKLISKDLTNYIVIVSGILEYHDNVASILAQEAQIGQSHESAKAHLLDIRKQRLEMNRKENVDFTQKERELRENLTKAKAGSL